VGTVLEGGAQASVSKPRLFAQVAYIAAERNDVQINRRPQRLLWDTSPFQLVSDISEEYGKNCISLWSIDLESEVEMLKSDVYR
jgi:hypothetical protein